MAALRGNGLSSTRETQFAQCRPRPRYVSGKLLAIVVGFGCYWWKHSWLLKAVCEDMILMSSINSKLVYYALEANFFGCESVTISFDDRAKIFFGSYAHSNQLVPPVKHFDMCTSTITTGAMEITTSKFLLPRLCKDNGFSTADKCLWATTAKPV